MSDLISRQDAIEALKRAEALTKAFGYHNVIDTIRELPSAEPERKRGWWMTIERGEQGYSAGDFRCSVCGKPNPCYSITDYCPNCGADMRGGGDE